MTLVFAILALLFGADAKLTAPSSAAVGEYVLIDFSASEGAVELTCQDPEVDVFVHRKGTHAILHCGVKKRCQYTITATEGDEKSSRTRTIDFGGDGKKPAPAPKPDVKPVAPVVEITDRFKLQAGIKQFTPRNASAAKVADQLDRLRTRIAAGTVDVANIATMRREIAAATGVDEVHIDKWSKFSEWWGHELGCRVKDGSVKTSQDWMQFLDETVAGLKGVG